MEAKNSKNCKIAQDLMPSYLENLLSDESKLFVDEHIATCDNCRKYLNTISENIFNEKTKEDEINNLEIDSLKRYRKRMLILKRTLFSILLLIILVIIVVFARYKYHEHILNNALEKYEEIENADNFYIGRKSIEIDYKNNTTYEYFDDIYYKDGKYKRIGDSYIMCGQVDSTNYLEIFHETKTIEDRHSNYVPYIKKELIMGYTDIYNYRISKEHIDMKLYYLNCMPIRTEKYNNRECYVVRTSSSDNGYNEFWIDKESNRIVREISENYGLYYREYIYTLTFNQIKDEDVEINNLEQYSDYTRKNVILQDESMSNIMQIIR